MGLDQLILAKLSALDSIDFRGRFAALRKIGVISALSALACLGATACQVPAVSARAVWIDVRRGPEGERTLHTYDRGDFSLLPMAPLQVDVPMMPMELGPTGRYLLVRGTEIGGVVLDLQNGRNLPLYLPPVLGIETDTLRFAAKGDALAWLDFEGLNLVSLAPEVPVVRDAWGGIQASRFRRSNLSWFVSAEDESRIFAYGAADNSLIAFSYPNGDVEVAVPRINGGLVQIDMIEGVDPLVLQPQQRQLCFAAGSGNCQSNLSLDPSGQVLTVATRLDDDDDDDVQEPRQWLRWRIGSESNPSKSAKSLKIPEKLEMNRAKLLCQLDDNTYIFVASDAMYRWNRKSDALDSLPLLLDPNLQSYWSQVDDGHRLIWLDLNGRMLSIDQHRIAIENAGTTTCNSPSLPVISPRGRYAAWTCEPFGVDDQTPESLASSVLRVSASGLEIFRGISMSLLAVDDAGNLLMNSESTRFESDVEIDEFENLPRILYVLTSDGLLYEVDNLEPSPEQIQLIESDRTRFILARSYL